MRGVLAAWPRWLVAGVFLILAGLGINNALLYLGGREMDWIIFHASATAIGQGGQLYSVPGQADYIYPPFFAFAIQPLAHLSVPISGAVWVIINTALMALTLHLLAHRLSRFVSTMPVGHAYAILIAVVFAAFADQISSILRRGQTDIVVLLALVGALFAVRFGTFWTGAVMAVSAAIKYQTALFLPLLLLRWQIAAAVGLVIGLAVLFALPALTVGWDRNADYVASAMGGLARLVGLSSGQAVVANVLPLDWERSVSLPSTFARLFGSIDLVIIAVGSVTALVGVIIALAYRRWRVPMFWTRRDLRDGDALYLLMLIEIAVVIAVLLVLSPQTTNRHMFLAAVPMALCTTFALMLRQGPYFIAAVIAVPSFWAANSLPPSDWAEMRTAWRAVGGASWALIGLTLVTVAAGFEVLRHRGAFTGRSQHGTAPTP